MNTWRIWIIFANHFESRFMGTHHCISESYWALSFVFSYRGGVDSEGRPVMVVVGAHFLLRCLDLERFVFYVVKVKYNIFLFWSIAFAGMVLHLPSSSFIFLNILLKRAAEEKPRAKKICLHLQLNDTLSYENMPPLSLFFNSWVTNVFCCFVFGKYMLFFLMFVFLYCLFFFNLHFYEALIVQSLDC